VYDFGRLMTASALIDSRILNDVFGRVLQPIGHNSSVGLMIFNGVELRLEDLVIAVIDDESEVPQCVVRWARSARPRALAGELQRTVKICRQSIEPDPYNLFHPNLFHIGEEQVVSITSDTTRAGQ